MTKTYIASVVPSGLGVANDEVAKSKLRSSTKVFLLHRPKCVLFSAKWLIFATSTRISLEHLALHIRFRALCAFRPISDFCR